MEKKINPHENHRERMRARIKENSLDSLNEHEVLEYLLYPFIPRKDTNGIAHGLIAKFGSLSAVMDSDANALTSVKGMTANAALYLSSLSSLARRYNASKIGVKPKMETRGQILEYLRSFMSTLEEERIYAVCVDSAGRLKERCELGRGSNSDCKLRVRELVMLCQNSQTKYVYLAHNHPSGIAKPSADDIDFTKWAVTALEIMDVLLIDHIIIAKNDSYSFLQDGRLDEFRTAFQDFVNEGRISDRRS